MKPARLIVKNFGPLKDVEIKVTDFLCLIGKQATGKSTIAKLIAVFEDENFRDDFFIQNLKTYGLYECLTKESYISYQVEEYNKNSILHFDFVFENKQAKLNNFKTYFNHLFDTVDFKDTNKTRKTIEDLSKLLIDGIVHFNDLSGAKKIGLVVGDFQKSLDRLTPIYGNVGLRLKDANENILTIDKKLERISKQSKDNEEYISIKDIQQNIREEVANIRKELSESQKEIDQAIENYYYDIIDFLKLDSQYIPSERNFLHIIAENALGLINNNVQIPKHLLEIGQEYEKAVNTVKEIPLTLIDKKFKYLREGKTSYIYHDSENKVDLLQSASGLQSILPIILLIEYAKTLKDNYHFNYVVEEPELNIYPETQHNLIKYLVSNIFDFYANNFQRKKLVITTHSPYILASINNLLLAFKKGKEKPKETHKIIKKESWINPQSFNAYELKNGKSYKIMNDKIGQIKSNIIDTVTDEFSDEFDKLLSL